MFLASYYDPYFTQKLPLKSKLDHYLPNSWLHRPMDYLNCIERIEWLSERRNSDIMYCVGLLDAYFDLLSMH